jgi:hypothetical protein
MDQMVGAIEKHSDMHALGWIELPDHLSGRYIDLGIADVIEQAAK